MLSISRKNIADLRKELIKNLDLDFFDDEEIDAILREVESHDETLQQMIFALCVVLSNKSSSFVPRTLRRIRSASRHLPVKELERWLNHAFDTLDAEGTAAFVKFTSRVDRESLEDFQHPYGIHLKRVIPILETFVRGISGMDLKIAKAGYSYTDTATIFLPQYVNRFEEYRKNYIVYKVSAVYRWGQIALGTLAPDDDVIRSLVGAGDGGHPDIASFFGKFQRRELALDIYNILETQRIDAFLWRELPGLMKEAVDIKKALHENRISTDILPRKTAFVECLYQYFLCGKVKGSVPDGAAAVIERMNVLKDSGSAEESLRIVSEVYPAVESLDGPYELQDISVLLGRIEPEKVSRRISEARERNKQKIKGVISKLMNLPDYEPSSPHRTARSKEQPRPDAEKDYLLIRGKLIEMDDDLKEVIDEQGGVPGGVLVHGAEAGGMSPVSIRELIADETEVSEETKEGAIKYDEWDYRRGGYKKDWCNLYERDIHPVNEPFVELTMMRYGGYVKILRKKFELLKREPRLLRRQREGEHVDIDATIEAIADMRAGLSPSENLFMRMDRQDRNIAVLFLIDMSGSTKGWVNIAEKEALVMMCEALEALGDRYAIYGFSGMTRVRCDYYRIKGFDEPYTDTVKKRIAGIQPKDYTRMGPPIRHSISILDAIEARTKLLITLSDGRPEDWDRYKGDYGIEDTRKSLVEAKERGIHSFCITIDREASDYLPRMYGEVNYIVIDDVRKLPNRITEIYRRLTT
jgi:nitric oxide reductase NorD protein